MVVSQWLHRSPRGPRVCVCVSVCVRKREEGGRKKKSEKRRKNGIWAAVWFRSEQRSRSSTQPWIDRLRKAHFSTHGRFVWILKREEVHWHLEKRARILTLRCIFFGLKRIEVPHALRAGVESRTGVAKSRELFEAASCRLALEAVGFGLYYRVYHYMFSCVQIIFLFACKKKKAVNSPFHSDPGE